MLMPAAPLPLPWASRLQPAGEAFLPGDPHRRAGYPAGGTIDQARHGRSPKRCAEVLGQTVIVENKPGAGGTIGTDYVAKQPADGYTLVFGNSGPIATAGLMRAPTTPEGLPADLRRDAGPGDPRRARRFAPQVRGRIRRGARSRGDKVNHGSTGVGSSSHPASEVLQRAGRHPLPAHPLYRRPPLLTALPGARCRWRS